MALTLPDSIYLSPVDKTGERPLWDSHLVLQQLQTQQPNISLRTAERAIIEAKLVPTSLKLDEIRGEQGQPLTLFLAPTVKSVLKPMLPCLP